MKKFIISGTILLTIAGFALTVFYSYFNTTAEQDFPYEGDEPDMPAFMKNKGDKEDFMLRRAEGIGLKRGIDNDKPLPNPKLRQTAIAEMERQQETLANMPESEVKESLTSTWTPIGPAPIPNGQTVGVSTPVSGRVTAIAVHPTNPSIVYVGAAQGGLYRTTDGGTNWTPILDTALSLAIGAVAIAPSQPETVYVGTGEGNFSFDSFFGTGVYRIDNASSASPTVTGPLNRDDRPPNGDTFTGRAISKIVINHVDPSNIWVASTSGNAGIGGQNTIGAPLPNRGIYRSFNATSANPSFRQIGIFEFGNIDFDIHDIVLDPLNVDFMVANPHFNGGGVYVSFDARANNPTFISRLALAGVSTRDVNTEFAIHHTIATQPPTIYAATGNGGGRVLRSTDFGATWTNQITNNFCGFQCFYDIAVAVDPNDQNRVYLGGDPNMVFGRSTNGGTSFTRNENGLHTDTHVIAVAPSLPTTIYLGTDGGIYKSTDSGTTWTPLNNSQFNATQFMSLAVHPTDPNFTIGGTQDNGTNFFQPQGTWTRADFGDGGYALIDQNSTDTTNVRMYHTYFNNGTLQGYGTVSNTAQAMDNGWTFRGCQSAGATTNGITCTGAVNFYAPLARGPGNPNTVYFGTDRLYRSTDTGLNHTIVSQAPITANVPISAIGISPQNDNVRIVGQNNGGIWGTITGSSNLTNLDPSNAVPNNYIARAVIDPNNQNTAYVTLSAFGVTNVWKTTNLQNGVPTWTAASGSGGNILPQIPVNAFVVDPTNSNTLYCGTDIGVFISTNGGTAWMPFGTGLPRVAVFDMAITANRKLRVATHGRGMWEVNLTDTPSISINDVSMNEGNTGTTAFTFNVSLSNSANQTVTVNYATANDTAIAGSDYIANSGTLTFNPGETSKPITVLVNGDIMFEQNETFFVNLSNPVNATISDNQGVGTIVNDDSAISINDVSMNEGNSGTTAFTFTVNVTPPGLQPITVNYSTANGTAVAPGDYTSIPQTLLVFGTGEASKQITVQVNGDTTIEPNETFFVNLSNPSNAVISDDQGVGTILNDDNTSGCNYSINPTNQNFPVSGGSNNVQVTAPSGCAWTAVSNNSFVEPLFFMRNQTAPSKNNDFINSLTANINGLFSPNSPNTVFSNTSPITIPDSGTATPYPSDIPVSGMTGTITDLNVKINNLSHTFPDDFAMLLVSPDGNRKFILQSDSGGGTDVVNLTYTFDDQAVINIPDDGPMPPDNGSVRPSSIGDNDGMPPPAPAEPYSQPATAGTATLNGTFGGINPNGTWKLFVIDFVAGDGGSIGGGWSLDITTQGGTTNFITITSGQNGNGNGTVGYSVGQNTTGQPRTATMTIAGQTFTVNQSNTTTVNRKAFDLDGDGKTDVGIFRPAPGEWWYLRSSDGGNRAFSFGQSTDKIVAADYTGDGRTDIAFFRPASGEWFILRSEDSSFYSFPFGNSTDIPTPADFDGDGKADPAIFRPSTREWFIVNSSGGTTITTFGIAGDLPVAADYDGDNKADIGIYRPSNGQWWLNRSTAGLIVTTFGISSDKTVQADYTGDGKADVAFFRPSTREWFVLRSEDFSFYSAPFGAPGDIASPGDYDGDGRTDFAIFRPSNNTWFIQQSTSGFTAITFGITNDIPIPNAYVR